jgi:glycosyltransferase involved in cell wall biosynthesis
LRPEPVLPTVSVVVPTRDRADLLERCLEAVLADEATSEVMVVVDGSDPRTDGLLGRLAERDQRVRVTRTPEEPASLHRVQRGRDHGVGLARSDVVLSIDDDVVAEPGLVAGHARAHVGRDDLVVVGYMPVVTPRRWPGSHAQIDEYAGAYEELCEQFAADSSSILPQLWGGNVSVHRRRWLEAIQQNPRIGSYLDDKELGLHFQQMGLQGKFDPGLRADHFYERSLRGMVERAERNCIAQADLRATFPAARSHFVPGPPPRAHLRLLRAISRSAVGWFAVRWGLIGLSSAAAALRISPLESKTTVALSWLAFDRTANRLP